MSKRKLTSKDKLTTLIKSQGIETWEQVIEFVRCLPYGRNSNRTNLKLVITEQRGTCSSKHAILKKVAHLNKISNIKLILGMYRMNEKNTPNIGNILTKNSIDYIPEAHCYLMVDGKRIDLTTSESSFDYLKNDIIQEIEIQPEQVANFKVTYHKEFIKDWLQQTNSSFIFEQIWRIREKCIKNMSK